MMDAPPPKDPLRRIALVACGGLVMVFGILSYSAALTKSATYDEPFHALAGWLKVHRGDFRMDYESLPLATGWAALANSENALQFNEANEDWRNLHMNPYRGFELATDTLYRTPGNDGATFINRSRFMMTLLGMGLGMVIIIWAWRIGGPLAGVAAGTLFAFDPNLLGHASLVKTDIAVSLAMAGAIWAAWSVGRRMTWRNSAILALATAAAMNTKFSAVLLVPMLVMLLGIRAFMGEPWTVMGRVLASRSQRLLAAMVLLIAVGGISVLGTWAAHGFRFAPSPDPSIILSTESYRNEILQREYYEALTRSKPPEDSAIPVEQLLERLNTSLQQTEQALAGATASPSTRLRLSEMLEQSRTMQTVANGLPPDRQTEQRSLIRAAEDRLGLVRYIVEKSSQPPAAMLRLGDLLLRHRLMPSAWTNGLMVQYARSKILVSYLFGAVRHEGSIYFYPLAILVKTPLATLLTLGAVAIFGINACVTRRVPWRRDGWTLLCLCVPMLVFTPVVMTSNLNIGLRHLFPAYPFGYVAAGVLLGAWTRRDLRLRRVAIGLAILLAAETLAAWPNYISFFNLPTRVFSDPLKLLGDSNLDWGQDLPALARRRGEHPARPLVLAYFGTVDPHFYGLEFTPAPPWPPPPELLRTHVLAISASHLQGIFDPQFAGYQQLMPREVLGGTIYLYYDGSPGRK